MKSYYLACTVCGSMDQEELFPSFYSDSLRTATMVTPLQAIVICRQCGLVFRNPFTPDLCLSHYGKVQNWGEENPDFVERSATIAASVARHMKVRRGELYLDVGAGPGWLVQEMQKHFPEGRAVLLEPSISVAEHAKSRNPAATVLPSMLDSANLPPGAFSVITVCGVDYLFENHREDIERIHALLKDGGLLYVERNVFVDQEAYFGQPIFDPEDLFGLNHRMNTWFGRDQFPEYLEEFFEIEEVLKYDFDPSPRPFGKRNELVGVYCRKRPGGERKMVQHENRYEKQRQMISDRAIRSSLDDLKKLAARGIRSVAVCGDGPEVQRLADLIVMGNIFDSVVAGDGDIDQNSVDAFLLANTDADGNYRALIAQAGHAAKMHMCLRPGIPFFESLGDRPIQMKAFLPSAIPEL